MFGFELFEFVEQLVVFAIGDFRLGFDVVQAIVVFQQPAQLIDALLDLGHGLTKIEGGRMKYIKVRIILHPSFVLAGNAASGRGPCSPARKRSWRRLRRAAISNPLREGRRGRATAGVCRRLPWPFLPKPEQRRTPGPSGRTPSSPGAGESKTGCVALKTCKTQRKTSDADRDNSVCHCLYSSSAGSPAGRQ